MWLSVKAMRSKRYWIFFFEIGVPKVLALHFRFLKNKVAFLFLELNG